MPRRRRGRKKPREVPPKEVRKYTLEELAEILRTKERKKIMKELAIVLLEEWAGRKGPERRRAYELVRERLLDVGEEEFVRRYAARASMEFRYPETIKLLMEVMSKDPNAGVRREIWQLFEELGVIKKQG